MRHAPFAVTPTQAGRWLGHMRTALEEAELSPEHLEQFWEYVVRAAHFLVNTPDAEPTGHVTDVPARSPLDLA
jgi:hemoglobin